MTRSAVFLVKMSQPSAAAVTIGYATVAGTATAGSDFTSVSGTITFAPGQTVAMVIVPVRDNVPGLGEEQFTLQLSSPINATLANSSAKCVLPSAAIERQPVVTVNNISVT